MDKMSRSRVKTLLAVICILLAAPYTAAAATYYVSPNGSDSNDGLSTKTPWGTLVHATKKMSGGDTLILMDGIYTSNCKDYSNCENQLIPPSGSPGNYTVIKAQNDWKAVIDGSGFPLWRYPIHIKNGSYIQIEGLKLVDGGGMTAVMVERSSYIKLMRLSITNGVPYNAQWGNVLSIANASHHILVEDTWISGAMRYGVLVIGDNDGPVSSTTYKVILRRVVVRFDYIDSVEPKAAIAFYGADKASNGMVRDSMCQNCIVIDTNPANSYKNFYGAYYNPKITENIKYYGSIALNIKASGLEFGSPYDAAGFYVTDNYSLSKGHELHNVVAWDVAGVGIRFDQGDSSGSGIVNQSTVGYSTYGVMDTAKLPVTLQNSIIYNNAKPNAGVDISKYNTYVPPSHAEGSNYKTTDPGLRYLVRTTDTGTGLNGMKIGADIEKRYGVSGTLWDEPGYDQLTNVPLWPWPYEDQIKKDFSASNVPPLGAYPPTNDTKRGFCAPG
ncbi:MAG TPA: hypothetical protein ENJ37_06655, partial [Deltaproteobacteria bacterium]|nr:hypothetical protein [Deltaproteobacteria bacterium]